MANAARKVFLSYAHSDGSGIAQLLEKDLQKAGCDIWLDRRRLTAGSTWSKEIEEALDTTDVVLALLTPGAYLSEICRAEQLRGLRKGKCVIPVRASTGVEVPLHLEAKQYVDLSALER